LIFSKVYKYLLEVRYNLVDAKSISDEIINSHRDKFRPKTEVRTMEDEDTLVLTPEEKDKILENLPKTEKSDDDDDDDTD